MTPHPPRTVRVRVPVIIDEDGRWRSFEIEDGWSFSVSLRHDKRLIWLTADLPLPSPTEAEATVERQP